MRTLEVTPPPLLYRAFGGDIDALVHHMKKAAESGIRSLRVARQGPAYGARRMRRLHPWDEPRSLRETGGQRLPSFKIGAKGIVGRQVRIDASKETSGFRRNHEDSRLARLGGDFEAEFPYGTYEWGRRGAPVQAAPPPGALVSAPGPLLVDVQAELERDRDLRTGLRQQSRLIIDEVREAFAEEAQEVVEHAGMTLSEASVVRVSVPNAADAEKGDEPGSGEHARPTVVVRHRFDRRIEQGAYAPRRVVVLRDRRRGRPATSGKHGDDPPG